MARRKYQPYSNYQPAQKSCGGKVRYAHKHEAEQAAEEVMIIEPELHLRVYKCAHCGGWHLTKAQPTDILFDNT